MTRILRSASSRSTPGRHYLSCRYPSSRYPGSGPALVRLSCRAAAGQGEVIADAERLVAVVGDVHGGDFEIGQQLLQQGTHVFARWLIQRGQRLVEQQQAGPDSQGTGESDPLALTAAERAW